MEPDRWFSFPLSMGRISPVKVSIVGLLFGALAPLACAQAGGAELAGGAAGVTVENPIIKNPGSPAPAVSPAPGTPRRKRAISPEVAAQLAAAQPKFEPAPPKPPVEEEDVDLREIDKPRNGIIRLPKFVVREPLPPVFSERAVHTDKGLANLALKRYGTEAFRALNPFAVPMIGSPEAVAMMMYEEDERLRNMADFNERARMMSATDKEAGAYVKKQVDSTFMRPGSFEWRPTGR